MQHRAAAYGLEGQGKSMCPFPSPREDHCRFLAATSIPAGPNGEGNKVCLVEYDSSSHRVSCVAVWGVIGGPVAEVKCSHSFAGESPEQRCVLVSLVHAGVASLYLLTETGTDHTFVQVGEFPKGVVSVMWDPKREDHTAVRIVLGMSVCLASVTRKAADKFEIVVSGGVSCGAEVLSCAWDPVDTSRVAATTAKGLVLLDMKKGSSLEVCRVPDHGSVGVVSPHGTGQIKTVVFSPGQSHTMITGGGDGSVAYWGMGEAHPSVRSVHRLHSHWVLDVSVNRLSGNLLLTGSADRCGFVSYLPKAAPTKAPKVTSEGWGSLTVGASAPKKDGDGVVKTLIGELGDSVCSVCWAYESTFVMAAMAFNGRILISPVDDQLRKQVLREV
jgi:hypothetical protein